MTYVPFAERPIRFHGLREPGGYRLKLYSVVYGGGPPEMERFERGLALAFAELPRPAVVPGRPGAGFAILHQGSNANYVVLGWWDRENELPLRVFVRDGAWRPARGAESICVWDLELLWHERCAYVETVLAKGEETAVEDYLARIPETAGATV